MKNKVLLLLSLVLCLGMLTACELHIDTKQPTNNGEVVLNTNTPETTITPLPTNDETREYTEVKVSSAKDIFQNIQPYTRIILTEPTYNLSEINVTTFQNDNVRAENAFDGFEFIIHDVDHFEICSAPNVMAEIVTPGPHVNPIYLENCHDVKLEGIVSGHTVEKGSCSGAVMCIRDCSQIQLDNCHLYGSGIYGIVAYDCSDLTVNNSEIYDCSYGLVDFNNSKNFTFNNCTFRDSEELDMFCIRNCNNIVFNNCTVSRNHCLQYCDLIVNHESTNVQFNKCIFTDNLYDKLHVGEEVEFNGCKINDQPLEYNWEEEYEYYDIEDDTL